jgi:hypothetical protein
MQRAKLGFWMAVGVVFVCGLVSGAVVRTVTAGLFFSAAAGMGTMPLFGPGVALGQLIVNGLAGVAVTAGLVTAGVPLVSDSRIGYGRALRAGAVAAVIGLLPVLVLLSSPLAPGSLLGLGLLSLPLGGLALGVHAALVRAFAT